MENPEKGPAIQNAMPEILTTKTSITLIFFSGYFFFSFELCSSVLSECRGPASILSLRVPTLVLYEFCMGTVYALSGSFIVLYTP
jgi:hypothetical protein